MIDWYIVLVPLVLLPIFLLFVFTGCVLDREGLLPTGIKFEYSPGLNLNSESSPGLERIEWEYNLKLDRDPDFGEGIIGSSPGGEDVGPFVLEGTAIKAEGGTNQYDISIETYGPITCKCTVVTKPNPSSNEPSQTIVLAQAVKNKIEDETPPKFQLSRDGTVFLLS
jgi:hypothetical protein